MAALTRDQQIRGQKQLLTSASINPIGGGIIMGPLISLLALFYGASDFSMGLIYASIYLTSISALVPPLFLNRFDFSKILGYAWLIRSFFGGGFLIIPFIENNDTKIILLVIFLYCFMFTRSIGAGAASPVVKALNRSSELTRFTASIWSRWYFGILCTTIISYVVLQYKDAFPSEESAYMSLIAMAFVFNTVTALMYLKLPNTGRLDRGGLVSLARAVHYIRQRSSHRDVILIGFLQVSLSIAAAYQLSHLQGPLEFSPGFVFALTLAGVIGAFLTAKLVSLLGDSVSFRSLLFLTHFILAICGIGWLFINQLPSDSQVILASGLYIITTTMMALSATVLAAMSNARLPDELRLEVSTIYLLNMAFSAVCALCGIAFLRWVIGDYFGNPYCFAYLPWIFLCICICVWAIIRRSDGDPEILSELLQLKPSNIHSIYAMQRVSKSELKHSRNRVRQIENALLTDTPASRESLLRFLQSSHITERLAAYYSLFERPFDAAYPIVVREALDSYSPIRSEAVTALGLSGEPQYIDVLKQLLNDKNKQVVSASIKSLFRLNADVNMDFILQHYQQTHDYRQRHDIVIGLSENKQHDVLKTILINEGQHNADCRWLITVSLQWADTFDKQHSLATLLQLEEEKQGEGIEDVLREFANTFATEWSPRFDNWMNKKDPLLFIEAYPELKLWPVRHHIDLLLLLVVHVWTDQRWQ